MSQNAQKILKKNIIIDFDSTFTKVEGLDELAAIALETHPERAQRLADIRRITNEGMEGKLTFSESLNSRIQRLQANRQHLPLLVERLRAQVSASFQRNKAFLQNYADHIYIISSGFREFIAPIVMPFGIKEDHIFANEFRYDAQGNIIGYREDILLCKDKGKVLQIRALDLKGDVYVLGDGYTDYEIREAGLANKFYAFTENVVRDAVSEKADHVAPSLDEFLFDNQLPAALSYPKNRIRVLVLENIHPKAVARFQEEGYSVDIVAGGLDEDELCERIKNVSILCIRSKTQVTPRVLEHANKLMAIGAFCIGTNQIALDDCLKRGIAVFNAPYSNTRSVVELALGQMILLMRNTFVANRKMHAGIWDKSAKNSYEVRGKKLGIIGYGNIGAQLSVIAESLGLEVYYYDTVEKLALGNAKKVASLDDLLQVADIVTLHVDGRKTNQNIIGEREFGLMKEGVIFLNLSRGFVVDIDALVAAIKSGKVRGASVDVFPYEPKTNDEPFQSPLLGLDNVILTPHIGGSTEEAQENIAEFVPAKLINYINKGDTFGSVNFPNLQLPEQQHAHRLIHIHHNTAGILAQINQVLAQHQANILGQYLKTNEHVGYVITDIDSSYQQGVIADLKNIGHTIKFRVLY